MAMGYSRRERPGEAQRFDISRIYLVLRAESGAGVILGRHNPLAIIGLILNLRQDWTGQQENANKISCSVQLPANRNDAKTNLHRNCHKDV